MLTYFDCLNILADPLGGLTGFWKETFEIFSDRNIGPAKRGKRKEREHTPDDEDDSENGAESEKNLQPRIFFGKRHCQYS